MKDFSQRLDYDIPIDLQESVMGIIWGKTDQAVTISSQPMYATGFPLLVHSQGVVPHFKVNGQSLIPKSKINVAGQIFEVSVSFSLNGMLDNIGVILHPMATYYLFHKPGSYFLNSWKSIDSESGIDSKLLYRELSKDLDLEQKIGSLLEFMRTLSVNRLPAIGWLD